MKNKTILNEIKPLRKYMPTKKEQIQFDRTLKQTKEYLDKLYNFSFVDSDINVGNFRKMQIDVENLLREKGKNIYVLTVRVKQFKDSKLIPNEERVEKNDKVKESIKRMKEIYKTAIDKDGKIMVYRVDNTLNILFDGHKKGVKMRDKMEISRDLFPDFLTIKYGKLHDGFAKTSKNIAETIILNTNYRGGK